MIFKCRITLADTIDKCKYLVSPRQYKNYFHLRIRALVSFKFKFRYNKTLIGQQFRPTLDLLCHEDFNVGLSFASSNIEIFMAQ